MEWEKITPRLIAEPPTEANTVTAVMTAEVPEASGELIGAVQARGARQKSNNYCQNHKRRTVLLR